MKHPSIKSLSSAKGWFVVLDCEGTAKVQRIIAWVVLDGGAENDEIAAAVRDVEEGISIIGEFSDEFAGFVHRSELGGIAERFKLKVPDSLEALLEPAT